MHEEYKDLIIIAVAIFLILLFSVLIIGYNMKGDRTKVKTIISRSFSED